MTDFTNLDYLRDHNDLTVVDMHEPSRVDKNGRRWPAILIRCGRFAAVVRPVDCAAGPGYSAGDLLTAHLSIDTHPYVDEREATVGVGAMSRSTPLYRLGQSTPETGTTSGTWPSFGMGVAVIGEQG